jgi:hypothetical protein
MGHYTILKVGKEELSWKYDIPSYLSFLFNKDDFFKNPGKGRSKTGDFFREIGFQTTCKKALEKLDQLGFDWPMLSQVYSYFYSQLIESVDYEIQEKIRERFEIDDESKLASKVKAYYKKFPIFTREQELKDFTRFYLPLLGASNGKKNSIVKSIDGRSYKLVPDKDIYGANITLQELDGFLYGKCLDLPPWIIVISHLFDYEIMAEFAEIISVVQIKILLEGHSPNILVKLDLTDMIEDEEKTADFHLDSANRLVDKINLYNKFFTAILNEEKTLQEIYIKQKLIDLIDNLGKLKKTDVYLKGRIFEDLIEIIFSSIKGLEIIDKRMSNGDEEIDLIVKNNIDKTFWSSLTSPCFFVECKNWSGKINSKEIRDFETKMRNHSRLVKVGFVISFNGFTKEAITELKRSSRDEYHIVTIDGNDIKQLISSKVDMLTWLEMLVTKFY